MRTVRWLVVVGVMAAALVGCASSRDTTVGTPGGHDMAQAVPREGADMPQDEGAMPQDKGTDAPVPADSERKIARSGWLSVQVDSVDTAAASLRQKLTDLGGTVSTEEFSGQSGHWRSGQLVVRVPAPSFDKAMDAFSALGDVHSRSSSTDDVTDAWTDTKSRITTLEASVKRLRAMLADAQKVSDMAAVEKELATREADLDSLRRRMAALDDRVATSTISVSLMGHAEPGDEPGGGFLGGLERGWRALVAFGAGLATLAGMMLPFLLASALVAGPVVWWRQRRVTRRRAATQPEAQGAEMGAEPADDATGETGDSGPQD